MFLNRAGVQNGYSHKVRVGNWSETQELEELRMKDYLHRKEKGQLLVHSIQKQTSTALQEVGLSFCPDGVLHIGDSVMLYSVATSGVLSTDPAERVGGGEGLAVTTSTLVKAHVARNTFVITPVDEREAPVGSVLRLGQQFRLRLNPVLLGGSPFYLSSQPLSSLASSKISRKQLVQMSPVKSFDSMWVAAWKDIGRRFENDGQPVPANAEVVLIHAPTNSALASSPETPYPNDFGAEFEVCAHSHLDIKKSQGLFKEMQGRTTTDIPTRQEGESNHWAFLTAASEERAALLYRGAQQQQGAGGSPAAASSSAAAASVASAVAPSAHDASVFHNVREELLSRGLEHVFSLYRSARSMDSASRRGTLSLEEFRKLLLTHGVRVSAPDFDSLVRVVDPRGDRAVDYRSFLHRLCGGGMNPRRAQVAQRIFDGLDQSNAGSVTLQALQQSYDELNDPEVALARSKGMGDQARVRDAQMIRMRAISVAGRVSRDDWMDYFTIVSAFVKSDDYFEEMLTKSWRVKQAAAASPHA